MEEKPTIKGIFVNSHINLIREQFGDEGVAKIESTCGKKINYKNSEDVLVSDEVRIIECALDMIHPETIPEAEHAFEAGKLHFQNFLTTPFAKIIFSLFRKDLKLMMLQTKNIAGHVFRGVHFSSEDLGGNAVRVTMTNNDYPIDHFRGLFTAWMEYAGYKGVVEAKELEPNMYQYTMHWQ